MKRISAASAILLAAVVTGAYAPPVSAQSGSIDNLIRSLDNVARGADGAVDDVIDGATDAARAGKRVGEGAGDVARQATDVVNPPPLRSVLGEGVPGAIKNAPGAGGNVPAGLLGAADSAPMLTDDIFEGFLRNAGEGADSAPRLATGGADAAGAADAVPGYTKPGAPAQFVDDASAVPGYTRPGAPPRFVDDVQAAAPLYDDFSKIGKIKPAKPPIKKLAIVVTGVDEFIIAPRAAVKTVKRASKVKKVLIGGAVAITTTAILGGTGYVLYETVGPVREGIDTAVARTGEGFDTAYDATNQGLAVAGEKLKAVIEPGAPATFVVQNNAGALVEVYKTTASGEELLYSLSQDQEKVVLSVAIGDKLSIFKGGQMWAAYDMTSDTNGIEVVVE
jgi:hypothetical protein